MSTVAITVAVVGRIRRRAARVVSVLEGFQSFRIGAVDALARGLAIKPHLGCYGRCGFAATVAR
jgi:hypothetical protein